MKKAFPAWFQLPDAPLGNCPGSATPNLHAGAEQAHRHTVELWERLYEPAANRLQLGYSGGSSSRRPKGSAASDTDAARFPSSIGFSIDPPPGSGDRKVAIHANALHGSTRVIFTFRPYSPP